MTGTPAAPAVASTDVTVEATGDIDPYADPYEGSPIGGKPYHGWSCTCPEECQPLLDAGLPRPGEVG